MTINKLKDFEILQAQEIQEDAKNPEILKYLMACYSSFWCGDFGEIGPDRQECNLAAVEIGQGSIYARYKKAAGLRSDLIMECIFDDAFPGLEFNHIKVFYAKD